MKKKPQINHQPNTQTLVVDLTTARKLKTPSGKHDVTITIALMC